MISGFESTPPVRAGWEKDDFFRLSALGQLQARALYFVPTAAVIDVLHTLAGEEMSDHAGAVAGGADEDEGAAHLADAIDLGRYFTHGDIYGAVHVSAREFPGFANIDDYGVGVLKQFLKVHGSNFFY
jgi:hypothetical protein